MEDSKKIQKMIHKMFPTGNKKDKLKQLKAIDKIKKDNYKKNKKRLKKENVLLLID